MKSFKIFLSLATTMALVILLSAETTLEAPSMELEKDAPESLHSSSLLRGITSRFLAQKKPRVVVMTCDKFPRVCRAKASPGPDCCKKQCVDVTTDRLNCGRCEKKCKFSEMCCRGVCVNPSDNEKNCGRCNNRCKKGSSCVFGMCSYA